MSPKGYCSAGKPGPLEWSVQGHRVSTRGSQDVTRQLEQLSLVKCLLSSQLHILICWSQMIRLDPVGENHKGKPFSLFWQGLNTRLVYASKQPILKSQMMAGLSSCSFQESPKDSSLWKVQVCNTNNLAHHFSEKILWEDICSSNVDILHQNTGKEAPIGSLVHQLSCM